MPTSSPPSERRWVALLCLVASLRVLVYAAAFPFFDNADEQLHYDMVMRYAHAQVPRDFARYTPEAARSIARWGSPEYFYAPGDYPGGAYPPLPWSQPAPMQERLARSWEGTVNLEAHAPPLYYAVAGAWLRLEEALGIPEPARLYGIRLLNVPLIAALVWLAFAIARALFPENGFVRIAVPALVAFIPQDAFYSIQSDVLSPLCFGVAFLGVVRMAGADVPSPRTGALTGLAAGAAALVKTSNFALVAAWGVALLFEARRRLRTGTLRAAAPALGLAAVLAALPILAWLAWNAATLGDPTGTAAKIAALDWKPKPPSAWWPHPLFTPAGVRLFWTELTVSFWRGEFVWHGQPLALPAADAFYAVSSALLPALAVLALLRGSASDAQRRALWLAVSSLLLPMAFLALLSIRFDFGQSFYPSQDHPFFTSGRLLSGALIPFALLYAFGLDRALAWTGRAWPRAVALAGIVLLATLSEAIANRSAFSSEYNWFSLLTGSPS